MIMRNTHTDSAPLGEAPAPSLSEFLRALRKREGERRVMDGRLQPGQRFSRELLAREVPFGVRTLEKIELGQVRQPTMGVLESLAKALNLSRDEFWCLCDLADYGRVYGFGSYGIPRTPYSFRNSLAAVADLPLLQADLADEQSPDLIRILDQATRIVGLNAAHRHWFPHCRIGDVWIEWFLSTEARTRILDWQREFAIIFRSWRSSMAMLRTDPHIIEVHRRLWRHQDYRELWESGTVHLGRSPGTGVMRVCDSAGVPHAKMIELSFLTGTSTLLVAVRTRVADHSGDADGVPIPRAAAIPVAPSRAATDTVAPASAADDDAPMPSLGQYLTLLRRREERRRLAEGRFVTGERLSRGRLAAEIPVGARTIEKIETGEVKRPTMAVLHAFADALRMTRDEFWHLCDLADYGETDATYGGFGVARDLPEVEDGIRAIADVPLLCADLAEDRATDAIVLLDPLWRIVAFNTAQQRLFPDQRIGQCSLDWYLGDAARRILVDWRHELAVQIRWWRCIAGRYRNQNWVIEQHRRLSADPDYRQLWRDSDVFFGRAVEHSGVRMRDRAGGPDFTLVVEVAVVTGGAIPLTKVRGRVVES